MPATYDVAVVGAGPAGSATARRLAEGGAAVVLIDKARFPRPKTCAGGISPYAASRLDLVLDEISEARITSVTLSYRSSDQVVYSGSRTLGWTVDRARFDAALAKKAVSAGVLLEEGLKATGFRRTGGEWEVQAGARIFRARFLVGADGVASAVARSAGVSRPALASSIETTVHASGEGWDQGRGRVQFDFGRVASGYAWAFAKSDHFSVGVFSTRRLPGQALRAALDAFVSRERVLAGGRETGPRRWLIPRGASWHRDLHFENGLLVGDAAGLADPLTGEGIGPALHSAELASRALLKSLEGSKSALAEYSREVDRRLRPGFRMARVCSSIAYAGRNGLVGAFVRSRVGARLWPQLVRGEVSYPALVWGLARFGWRIPFEILKSSFQGSKDGTYGV